MAEINPELTEQAQAVQETPEASTETAADQQGVSLNDAVDQLTTAQMVGASEAEIQRLEALVTAAQAPAETPAEPQEAVEPNEEQQQAEPDKPEEKPDDEPAEDTKVSKRVRLDHLPESERALIGAANLLAKATGKSFDEAWSQVNGKAVEQRQEQQAEPEAEHRPPEIAQLETEIADIEARLDSAAENGELFTPEIKELNRQQSKAYAKLEAIRARHEAAAQVEQSISAKSVAEQRQAILAQAVSDYPALKDRESVHWIVAAKMAQDAQDPGHPDHAMSRSIDAPRYFADKAAGKLGISKGATVSPSVPQQPQVQPAKTAQPAPGHRQTAPPPQQQSIADRIAQAEAAALAATTGSPVQANNGLRILIR